MIELGSNLILNKISCLYFYANWNMYHEKISNIILSFEKKSDEINFILVDIDCHKNIVELYKINEIPTFIFFDENKEIKRFSGVVLTKPFHSFCNKIIKGKNVGSKPKRRVSKS